MKRGRGISKAVDKLSKDEDMSLAPKGKGRKAAKRLYGEDISIVDAVQEVLGLGNKWKGMEKMPDTDKTKTTSRGTHPYKTQKTKITRLSGPRKKEVKEVTQAQLDKIRQSKQKGHLHADHPSLPSSNQQITDPKQLAALHKLKPVSYTHLTLPTKA